MKKAEIHLRWTENNPGWVASAVLTFTQPQADGKVKLTELGATSEVIRTNPLGPINDVLDVLCRQANLHPAGLSTVSVDFGAAELYEARLRGFG